LRDKGSYRVSEDEKGYVFFMSDGEKVAIIAARSEEEARVILQKKIDNSEEAENE
jgi:hypothetical protein